ncbi:MAG: hypothetical protein C0501_08755 [Isosphaera sp.]|nr:hypothetical protein [Isosphaera sp.]
MLQKRYGADEEREGAAAEAVRAAQPLRAGEPGDERVSLFWRVFGGTILSMVALGVLTLYNSISSNITDLRNELNREREARADLVRKDEFNARTSTQYERIRSLDALRGDHEGLRERVNAAAAAVDGLRKDAAAGAEALKRDAAALEVVKDRLAGLEGVRKEVAGLDGLREKVAAAAADLKAVREDLARTTQEQDRNRAADLERKAHRDAQYRHVEDALKELQKGLQDCREKLARLEGGMQPAGPPRPRPADPKAGPDNGN